MFPLHSGSPCWQVKGEFADGSSYNRRMMMLRLLQSKCGQKLRQRVHPMTCDFLHYQRWGSAYLSVPVGDQSDGHDVLQHGPGGEELLADEDSAGWTQTLIVQSDWNWNNRLVWSDSVQLHTLFLNLHEKQDSNLSTYVLIEVSKRDAGCGPCGKLNDMNAV